MLSRLTPVGRLSITLGIVLGLFGGYKLLQSNGLIGSRSTSESTVINKIDLPDAPKNAGSSVATIPLPSNKPANVGTPEVRWLMWAWIEGRPAADSQAEAKQAGGS